MPRSEKTSSGLLVVQIPCLDEEQALPITLAALPRQVPGVERVEWLVVDDGSRDATVEKAREGGVDHIVRHGTKAGLARAFATGLDASLRLGADIIVHTDADNQYDARDVGKLIEPILNGEADLVVGDRNTDGIEHFSTTKKLLHRLGSWVMRRASGTRVPDATCGFRAYSREAAMRLNIVSDFTYTLESLIQAGHLGLRIAFVPIRTNPQLRESRLFRSTWGYVRRSALTILRIYTLYRPLRMFFGIGGVLAALGLGLGVRYASLHAAGLGPEHTSTLVGAVLLTVMGFQACLAGVLADLVAMSRRLHEESLWRMRRLELTSRTRDTPEPEVADEKTRTLSLVGRNTG